MGFTALARSGAQTSDMEAVRTDDLSFETSAGLVSMKMTSDLQTIASEWRAIEAAAYCTSAQTFDWARAWSAHVLAAQGRSPVVAIGYGSDGQVQFLLPFETKTVGGLTVLRWLSQDHANYLFGLFRPAFASALSKSDLSRILNEVGRWSGASVAALEAQPFDWGGTPNPFGLLSHQPAPNSGFAVRLGDFETLYCERYKKRARQSLLRKERRLWEAGTLEYGWAETTQEKREVLETFFAQKATQFAAMGVTDIFTPEARAFYAALVMLPEDSPSRLRLGYVALNGEILATFSGTVVHDRVNVLLSSLADSPFQRQSPGAQLLRHQIEEACNDGLAYFDLGVGAARHKSEWSNEVYPLFDSYLALKPQGLAVTLPFTVKSALKRTIKSNPRLWALAQTVRRTIKGGHA